MPEFKYNRVLIVRLSSLGDVLLTTPLIRTLHQRYGAMVDFVVRREFASPLQGNPYIGNLWQLERTNDGMDEMKILLEERRYDAIIDLQNNMRSWRLLHHLDTPVLRVKKKNREKFLLVNFHINKLEEVPPVPVRYAEAAGIELDEKGLDLFIPAAVTPPLPGGKWIGFCPGAKHFTKRWPEEYFLELAQKVTAEGYRAAFFGGRDDRDICTRLAAQLPGSIDASTDNDLHTIAAGMRQCKAVVCNDSGLMHTVAAAGTPLLALFGSTVREFGFTPYGVRNSIFENNSLNCRPCSHIGKASCPKSHFRCMTDLKPDRAFEHLMALL